MKKRGISWLVALFVLVTSITWPPANVQAEGTNVALGKSATQSATESALPDNTGDKVTDGDENTRWSCGNMKTGQGESAVDREAAWLTIDLAAESTVSTSIVIHFYRKVWSNDYKIQTAATNDESTTWTDVKVINRTETHLDNFVDTVTPDEGQTAFQLQRFVRFYFNTVNHDAGGHGVSITEIEIIGTQDSGSTEPSGPSQNEVTNVAANKYAEVSAVETQEAVKNNTADKMVDGSMDTRWSCGNMKSGQVSADATQVPSWALIDLSAEKTNVQDIKIYFYRLVWGYDYVIQTAATNTEDTEWSTVCTVSNRANGASDQIDTFTKTDDDQNIVLQRYVRFYFNKVNPTAGGNGISIKEIQINGTQEGIISAPQYQTAAAALSGARVPDSITCGIDDTEIKLNQVAGYDIKVIGSEKPQIISDAGVITSQNIKTSTFNLIVEAKNQDASKPNDKARKNVTVTVPSKTSKNTALYPAVASPNAKPTVIPALQEWYGYSGTYTLTSDSKIVINDKAGVGLNKVANSMKADLKEISGVDLQIVTGTTAGSKDIYIESDAADVYQTGKEGYLMKVSEDGIKIYSSTYTGCLYGTVTVEQILWQDAGHDSVPCGVTRDYPDYEIRGVMFDVGRIPHRLQYLKDYTKILKWYKMSEYHLHLNDDIHYNEKGESPNYSKNTWSGMHRLESDVYKGLTDWRIYKNSNSSNQGRFDYYNNEYADPTYTKEDYRELEAMANDGGIDMIAELDTPSHATAYIEYTKHNNLPAINTTLSLDWNNQQLLALDTESSNATEKQNALNAREFMKNLYGDYLNTNQEGGAVFKSDTVHIGADEYWDKNNKEVFRKYVNYLDDLMKSYGKTTRVWGALRQFPGSTYISPENIVIDVWNSDYEEDPLARIADGFRVVNVPQPFLYVTPGRHHKDMVGEESLYKNWNPTMFTNNIKAQKGEPLLLGAKTALWGDEFREGITEADLHERMLRAVAITAEKTWGGGGSDDASYVEYQSAFDRLREGPGTEIAMDIDSKTDLVVDYDMMSTENGTGKIVIKDVSGNGYDAEVTGGTIETVDGKAMVKFDGKTVMTTPLKTLGYPYTVSFDVKALSGNDKTSLLFSGYDGQLLSNGYDGKISLNRSFYHQSFGQAISMSKVMNVTIVGTFQNTKMYVDGKLVKMLYSNEAQVADEFFSTFVFPLETIGKNFHGYIGNIKAYNKALQSADVLALYQGKVGDITEVNVALNTGAYSDSNNYWDPDLNSGSLKRHQAWKVVDGDTTDSTSTLSVTSDPHSFWRSSNNNTDSIMVDLGKTMPFSKVVITWEGSNRATSYKLQISSDGKSWTDVKTVSNTGQKDTITFAEKTARYVKMQGVSKSGSYYDIREIEVYQTVNRSQLGNLLRDVSVYEGMAEAAEMMKAAHEADVVYNLPTSTQEEIDAAYTALKTVYDSQELPAFRKGDVNKDGKIDLLDLRLLLRTICNKVTLDDQQKILADVNNDNKVDLLDLRQMLRYICGKIKEF